MPYPTEYPTPRRLWVEDGHILIEGHDGTILRMTPEVALLMGRTLSAAGAESYINKVMDRSACGEQPMPSAGGAGTSGGTGRVC